MNCLECKSELSYLDHRKAIERFGVELCKTHLSRMERLIKTQDIPEEAIILYYGLKEKGIHPMLAWWNGKQTIDLAVSRVKLNVEVDREIEPLSFDRAMNELEETMCSYKNGFTTIRIPHFLVKKELDRTIDNLLGIIERLKANVKVI
jgi:hypothetical protein